MLNLGDKIRDLRKKSRLTLRQLALDSNISTSYMSDIEKGRSTPSVETLIKIARVLKTTPGYLLNDAFMMVTEESGSFASFMAIVPVESSREFTYSEDNIRPCRAVLISDPDEISGLFFFRAPDDSMIGSRIKKDDLVLVKKQEQVENRKIFIISLPSGETMIRRVFKDGSRLILQSDNPGIKPVVIDSPEDINVLGKAVKVVVDLE